MFSVAGYCEKRFIARSGLSRATVLLQWLGESLEPQPPVTPSPNASVAAELGMMIAVGSANVGAVAYMEIWSVLHLGADAREFKRATGATKSFSLRSLSHRLCRC